jgi:hypothetical protein
MMKKGCEINFGKSLSRPMKKAEMQLLNKYEVECHSRMLFASKSDTPSRALLDA